MVALNHWSGPGQAECLSESRLSALDLFMVTKVIF